MSESVNGQSVRTDVREELLELMRHGTDGDSYDDLADAILARFDVVPKPPVTDEKLSFMAQMAVTNAEINREEFAQLFRLQLADAGLTIVRIEEGAR